MPKSHYRDKGAVFHQKLNEILEKVKEILEKVNEFLSGATTFPKKSLGCYGKMATFAAAKSLLPQWNAADGTLPYDRSQKPIQEL